MRHRSAALTLLLAIATSTAIAQTTTDETGIGGGPAFWILLTLLIGCVGINRWLWGRRPRRLCLRCGVMRQPIKAADKRLCCPNCHAHAPVPLDSPAAVEYLAHR